MKAIKDMNSLIQRISDENGNWQKIIYAATGVILLPSLNLFSNCGYISLDEDAEFSYSSGIDTTEYCEIDSIDALITYIKQMDSYQERLLDTSYGMFTKSELFWGVYERILLRHENLVHKDGIEEQEWGLFSIGQYKEHVELHMALIACDYTDIWLDITTETSLNEALEMLVSELNKEVEYQDGLPVHKVFNVNYLVPRTYEELIEKCSPDSVFGWLN